MTLLSYFHFASPFYYSNLIYLLKKYICINIDYIKYKIKCTENTRLSEEKLSSIFVYLSG